MQKWMHRIKEKEMITFTIFSLIFLLIIALSTGTFAEIASGMRLIVVSRDALITDYFELAGFSAAFFNATIVFGMGILLVVKQKIPFTGLTIAALFINAGYALWGKNPVNTLPILLGTILYARFHKVRVKRYIYTALFGTCLAPLITELVYIFPYPKTVNFFIAIAVGIFVGFVLPPLSMHTASMHMGYNLFNVGFSGGILAFAIVSVLRAFGMESDSVLIWSREYQWTIAIGLYVYFLITIMFGFLVEGGRIKGLKKILSHPGRAVTDFVVMEGPGVTLMNMGIIGMVCVTYILFVGGEFSGPVVGSIWSAFGFAAFGVHIKNYLPPLFGVYLSTFTTVFVPDTPGIQLAAIFAVGLAPIAGQFGAFVGVLAGFLHAAIAMCTSDLYGGLNLYNNGFSSGWVAVVLVPVVEGFISRRGGASESRRKKSS
ncbi:DUF1576 domain-containing protein [Kineothrix sp. MB12-C1]|uniref:DUF1576 domain-containing protein n=1 Tax=Kineothrix sp. MB12-C1 TaxID=3070215 RepID=UPI0027D29DA3|nr:DUF1576 domain-containing protein [Kineothrix sp. MB12-C1]WMC93395.1 DUF1576 domain-containing protein [Kineothrix sp. MB12-C1]